MTVKTTDAIKKLESDLLEMKEMMTRMTKVFGDQQAPTNNFVDIDKIAVLPMVSSKVSTPNVVVPTASTNAAAIAALPRMANGKRQPADAFRTLIIRINEKKTAAGKMYTNPKSGIVDRGVHVVFDQFNDSLRAYYGKEVDCKALTASMEAAGVIKTKLAPRGIKIYLPEEFTVSSKQDASKSVIGLD
jgi:hypothetical protein